MTLKPGVLVIVPADGSADLIAAGSTVYIRKARLVAPTAAGSVELCEAGGTVGSVKLAAVAAGTDTVEFYNKPFRLNGLKTLTAVPAGAVLHIYTEA